MKEKIDLPGGDALTVGHDRALGFFASYRRGRRWFEFDRFSASYNGDRPLDSLLQWLVAVHAIADADLDEGLLAYANPADDQEQLSQGGALALSVIEALKRAAAE